MSQFLKLSFIIINKNYIKFVSPNIKKQQYNISIADYNVTGVMVFGGGFMDTKTTDFKINKDTHPEDYKIVDDWIKHL
jgi:hypothetical protein